ncbi:MAG: S8 family serine peptidase [Candidatus Cryosericum sp.]
MNDDKVRARSLLCHVLLLAILAIPSVAAVASQRMILKFHDDTSKAFSAWTSSTDKSSSVPGLAAVNEAFGLQYYRALWRSDDAALRNIYRLDFPDDVNLNTAKAAYLALDAVEYAVEDGSFTLLNDHEPITVVPNDFWYNGTYEPITWPDTTDMTRTCFEDSTSQKYHYNLWHLPRTQYDHAWAITTGDSSVIVAVMDSGLDRDHPELSPLVAWNTQEFAGSDTTDVDGNHYRHDVCGYDFAEQDWNVLHDRHWWQLNGWDCTTPDLEPCRRCWEKPISAYTHIDSMECLWSPRPYSKDGLGALMHGTVMSSIIAAASNNRTYPNWTRGDVASINWKSKLLPLKVGKARPDSIHPYQDVTGNLSDALEAINYAIAERRAGKNIRVLNMSMTFNGDGTVAISDSLMALFEEAFATCRNVGILPVGGAGNANKDGVVYPCKSDNVLCTTCVLYTRERWTNSNGGGSQYGVEADVSAYGDNSDAWRYTSWTPADTTGMFPISCPIWEPWENPFAAFCRTPYDTLAPQYRHIEGKSGLMTSGTTAQVSGLAALVFSLYPDLSPDQVQGMIERGAVPINDPLYSNDPQVPSKLGTGVVDAYRTLTLWGEVARDTTLSGKVYVSGDVLVPSGRTLRVAAGTELFMAQDDMLDKGTSPDRCEIVVQGAVVFEGTEAEPIVIDMFRDEGSTDTWGPFVFENDNAKTHGVFEHVVFRNAYQIAKKGGNPSAQRIGLRFANCAFEAISTGVEMRGLGLSDSVAVSGCSFRGASASTGYGVIGEAASGDSSYVFAIGSDSEFSNLCIAVSMQGHSVASVTDCAIDSCGLGVWATGLDGSGPVVGPNVEITASFGAGIYLYYGAPQMKGCTITNAGSYGIEVGPSTRPMFETPETTIQGCALHGLYLQDISNSSIITNLSISNCGNSGVRIVDCAPALSGPLTIQTSASAAVYCDAASPHIDAVTMIGNTVAIIATNGSSPTMRDCSIADGVHGVIAETADTPDFGLANDFGGNSFSNISGYYGLNFNDNAILMMIGNCYNGGTTPKAIKFGGSNVTAYSPGDCQ